MTDEPDNKAGNDLTPEQKAEAARQLKKLLLGDEPGDDEEVFYYLSPFPDDSDEPDEEGDDAKQWPTNPTRQGKPPNASG